MDLTLASDIDRYEQALSAHPNSVPPEAFPLNHHFTAGDVYGRELVMPAGTELTGKAKKTQYISVLSAGFITEVTAYGVKHIKAPYTWVSEANTKRVLVAHQDSVITTIHMTTKTELAEIEAEILVEV